MTKIKVKSKADRAKPGPKPKPDEELAVKKTVSLRPETYKGLVALGDGVLSRGIEVMYKRHPKRIRRPT